MWKIDCKRLDNIHMLFYCLYCNLLTNHVIAIQKGKDSTAKLKGKKNKQKSINVNRRD